MSPRILIFVLLLAGSLGAADAAPLGSRGFYPSPERPIGWRGDGNGAYPGARPVTAFSEGPPTEVEVRVRQTWKEPRSRRMPDVGDGPSANIVWKTRLPAWAHAQPIIVGDRAITVAEPHSLVCVDMASGEILWERSNSPFELMGLPEREVAALEDYIARVYAARVPIAARTGNYRRLPGHSPTPWRPAYLEPVLAECALAEGALRALIAENPYGAKAEPALEAFLGVVEKVKALKEGDKSTKLGKPLVEAFYKAVDWIESEHKVPCLYGWDGYIGWTFATPVSDGERVYAGMGQGQAVAYDLEGRRIWGRRIPNLGKDGKPLAGRRTPSVRANHVPSPCLADGVFIVQAPDQLVGLDAANGKTLWRDPSIRVGGGYRVASHKPLRLDGGRWILVATAGRALDVKTGKVLCDFGLPCYGAEGAGASITGRDGVAYIVGSPRKREKVLAAIRFTDDGGSVAAETLWQIKSQASGQSPVLFGEHLYRFTGGKRSGDVFAIVDGSVAGTVYADTRSTSPSLIGHHFFTYDARGTRSRLDRRNVVAIATVELAGPAEAGVVRRDNLIDESEPPPDRRVERHLPEVYERIAANAEPPTWPLKHWAPGWYGNDGGIPSGFGVGGFCACGNRVVLRTISSLVCIGDPAAAYDWDPAARERR